MAAIANSSPAASAILTAWPTITTASLFGFDSDMEWDWGTPWYRPIRVFHAISGAEHGFREGASKWPEYYPDSLPGTVTMGIGCPTGVVFGDGAKFPAKYQRAFFIEDWTYGRLIAVHLSPEGASYGGTWENFLAPKSLHAKEGKTPLNMTGIIIGDDGAMYFTTGGRHTQGALFRITYTGAESTTPADLHDAAGDDARALRHQLEAFDGHEDAKAVDFAWPQLSSADRFLRYAARIAIESQPIEQWKSRALAETNPTAALTALLAVARLGGPESQADLFKALAKFPMAQLKGEAQQLEKLRVIEVALSRQGKPATDLSAPLIAELSPLYPAKHRLAESRALPDPARARCAGRHRPHAQAPRRRAHAGRATELRRAAAHDHERLDARVAPPVLHLVDHQARRQPASSRSCSAGLRRRAANIAMARASITSS